MSTTLKIEMNKSNPIALLVFSIFLISSVSATPAIITTTSTTGITVDTLAFSSISQNVNFTLNVHAYNQTSGLNLSNSTTTCNFHLENSSGAHVLIQMPMKFDVGGNDWDTVITAGNFTNNGAYSLEVWCFTGTIGGSERIYFEVTPNGTFPDLQEAILYIFIILGMALVTVWLLNSARLSDSFGWRIGYISLSYLSAFCMFFTSWSIANSFLYDMPFIAIFLYYTWYLMMILFPIFILIMLVLILRYQGEQLTVVARAKRMGN
jgi:hypothetical protein